MVEIRWQGAQKRFSGPGIQLPSDNIVSMHGFFNFDYMTQNNGIYGSIAILLEMY